MSDLTAFQDFSLTDYFDYLQNLVKTGQPYEPFLNVLLNKTPSLAEMAGERFIIDGRVMARSADEGWEIWEYGVHGINSKSLYTELLFKLGAYPYPKVATTTTADGAASSLATVENCQYDFNGGDLLTAILRISFNGHQHSSKLDWDNLITLSSLYQSV